jgi:hypothetical protein
MLTLQAQLLLLLLLSSPVQPLSSCAGTIDASSLANQPLKMLRVAKSMRCC